MPPVLARPCKHLEQRQPVLYLMRLTSTRPANRPAQPLNFRIVHATSMPHPYYERMNPNLVCLRRNAALRLARAVR